MKLNADFEKTAVVHAAQIDWVPSPMAGVERRMLNRIGDEVARATSIVRYAPGSHFSAHTHSGGEEFLVLEGVFQDEHGDYPAGTYVRNPPTSRHTPGSDTGCVIFVKLWQFDPDDRRQFHVDTTASKFEPGDRGIEVLTLLDDSDEQVTVERWERDLSLSIGSERGLELLVLEGRFESDDETFEKHSWLRLPPDEIVEVTAHENCRVWIKRNHLTLPIGSPAPQ